MARPTKDQVLTGEFSSNGSPWVNVASNSSSDLDTLEFSLNGSPWYGVEDSAAPPARQVKTWNSISISGVSSITVTPIANIKTINGVIL
jgi:hypothetical protein